MNSYRFAQILGRGIEGCGVTKYTLEFNNWLNSASYKSKIFALADKSWTRKTSHDVHGIDLIRFNNDAAVDALIREMNANYDYVVLNSLPPTSMSDEVINNFIRFINSVTPKVILIQNDHSSLSIARNAAQIESIRRSDVLFVHSITNDFADLVHCFEAEASHSSGLNSFFDDGPFAEVKKKMVSFQPAMSFDPIRNKYWKSVEAQDYNHHKWIGRTTSWKGYDVMFKFHNAHLKQNGALTTFEGIERSPAYLVFKELSEFHPLINVDIANYDLSKGYGDKAHVFGPYNNHAMLERMSKCGYGYQLSRLKPKFVERSIEYTHCEVACTGVIPVFRKEYGERCKHRHFKKPLIECTDSGTIWLGDDNQAECMEQMLELNANPRKRDEYRNAAFEFYKLHQDASHSFPEMMSHII